MLGCTIFEFRQLIEIEKKDPSKQTFGTSKGQIKPYTDWCAVNSPKERTNKIGFCAMKRCYGKKQLFVR